MSDVTENKELFQVYPTWVARVGEDGNPPEEKAQLSLDLIPRRVVLRAGGMQPDYAEFEYVDSMSNGMFPNAHPITRHVKRQIPSSPYPGGSDRGFSGFNEFAEVIMPTQDPSRKPDDDGKWEWKTANRRVLIGDIVSTAEESSSESYSVQAAVKPYMFGDVFRGMLWYHKATGDWVEVSGSDLSANPVVDGVSLPSMSDLLINDPPNFGEEKAVRGWAHPEIAKNISASVYHGQNIQPWTLRELVNTICWVCNPKESFIRNPFAAELTKVFEDAPPIEDVLLEGGRYLPYYLDSLLHPLGYNWFLDYDSQVPEEETETRLVYEKPRIRIFRKGYGDKREVSYQDNVELRMSSTTEPQEWNAGSDIVQYSLHRDVGNSYTDIRILGDYLRAEVTVPLHPGWLELYDTKTPDELDEENEDFEDFRDVQRLWVANEGADYSGMRTTKYPTPDPPDFSKVFCLEENIGDVFIRKNIHTVCVRRSMEPPLTFMGDKKVRRDLLLEVSFDSGVTWKEVQNGWSILPDQIAVYFTGKKSPIDDPEWRVAFEDDALRLRITGTISSDHRLVNDEISQVLEIGPDRRFAVNDRVNILDLHRHAKYRYWYVVDRNNPDRIDWKDIPYASVLAGSPHGAEVHDDRLEMNDYAQKLLYQAVNAEYEFECIVPGWHLDWHIGDLISKINGREIDLNQSTSRKDPAYCQVVGIEYSLDETEGPQTILTVDRGTRYVSDVYERRKRRLNRVEVH